MAFCRRAHSRRSKKRRGNEIVEKQNFGLGRRNWRLFSRADLKLCWEKRLVLRKGRDRGRQILPSLAFYDITLNANLLRLFHELTAFVHGEDEDGCIWSECVDSAGGVESIHQRHGDVENDEVRDRFLDLFDRFEAIRGFVADIKVNQ
jgi:hypothetical protein